jgi:hypothetical protein
MHAPRNPILTYQFKGELRSPVFITDPKVNYARQNFTRSFMTIPLSFLVHPQSTNGLRKFSRLHSASLHSGRKNLWASLNKVRTPSELFIFELRSNFYDYNCNHSGCRISLRSSDCLKITGVVGSCSARPTVYRLQGLSDLASLVQLFMDYRGCRISLRSSNCL